MANPASDTHHQTSKLLPLRSKRERLFLAWDLFLRVAREEGLGTALQRSLGVFLRFTEQYLWWLRAWFNPRNNNPFVAPAIASQNKVVEHSQAVDIVVCVHNALKDVRQCLTSIIRYTRSPYRIILIDDGSDLDTSAYLKDFANLQGTVLERHETALGYTLAANHGLRQSSADYVVLLNSDTIVTDGWLDRLIACAETDEKIGIVGPLSNTASWQSVPELLSQTGDWAENQLPTGVIAHMGQNVACYSAQIYPRLQFLNGFCLLIKRSVITTIGFFDEVTFGKGYGEENDYCLRAQRAGFELAVADDTYVYHAQSRSYSNERRKQLSQQAHQALITKHGMTIVDSGVQACRYDQLMHGIRAHLRVIAQREELIEIGQSKWEGRRILILLPIGGEAGGGSNVILQEAQAMRLMGVDVRIVNTRANRLLSGANVIEQYLPIIYIERPEDLSEVAVGCDAVIATWNATVNWLDFLPANQPIVRSYYIQDFEPWFFSKDSVGYKTAWQSYTRHPQLVRFTKTDWNRIVVKEQVGVDCAVIGPSVNLDLFRPRRRRDGDWPHRPLRVAAMIRPSSPRRSPKLTMELLRQLQRRLGGAVEIILFGCTTHDPGFVKLPRNFAWRSAGIIQPAQLAFLLNEVDIFTDFSEFQAMGLTAMEAMACGVAVIVPQKGGAHSFASSGENSLMVDTTSYKACWEALQHLALDHTFRQNVRLNALDTIVNFFPERAAYNALQTLFSSTSP